MFCNPEMLKLAREVKGLSQEDLAGEIGMKQAILSKYEQGVQMPPRDTLKLLGQALGFPTNFFTQEEDHFASGLVFHRSRTSLPAKSRNQVEADVRIRILEANKLMPTVTWEAPEELKEFKSPEDAARKLRSIWNVPRGPIANIVKLLENNGIVIIKFDFQTDKLDGFFEKRDNGLTCIALNSEFSNDRLRFTLAHELGHIVMHGNSVPGKTCEKEANAFSAEFLLPEKELSNEFDKCGRLNLEVLAELKRKWSVSMGALLYRANTLKKVTESQYRRLWATMTAAGYRKKEPDMGIQEEVPDVINNAILEKSNKGITHKDIANELMISKEMLIEHYPILETM